MQRSANDKPRLETIDFARGIALVAMAIYHLAWDLEFFGYADPGMTATGGWRLFARSIASSFLFLVGVSLVLAHARGVRWRPFLKRLAMVALAAGAISLVTWLAVPGGFIFFGILHQIALASLLGMAFLRLPVWLVVLAAVAVIAAPQFLRSAVFDHPALWWVGLSSANPRSNDYVPLFPWFGAVLLGMAATRVAEARGLFGRLRPITLPAATRPIQAAGRHSLAFYLIHQPLLIASVWLFSQVFPAAEVPRDIEFTRACTAQCEQTEGAEFCSVYCVCVLEKLETENRFDEVYGGAPSPQTSQRLQEIVSACSFEAEPSGDGEDMP
ncbi:DUF1624 domain-containing protein [Mesorhizobium sp. CAU 1741]|uniref:heparan-alpha-glucosaminide N-acetyltransferase n=1 Tax=Mesorhizobium sp. CAU 1741 TaxID=3140366 RepID=UPI00325BF05E